MIRVWLCVLLGLGACEVRPATVAAPGVMPAPAADDRGELCAELPGQRVCWSGAHAFEVPRPLPSGAAPPAGYRCAGMRDARFCEDRARNGSAFRCDGERCVQTLPRMPDDSEWDCVEMSGAVYCRSRAEAAGIASGSLDAGWLCGPRRSVTGERVCIDLDHDRPDARRDWKCNFQYFQSQPQRICVPANAPLIGSACGPARACPAAVSCVDGRCLPVRPEPSCWYDADCGAGAVCRWGTCERGGA